MKTLIQAVSVIGLATVVASGATFSNPWSGVLGDRANLAAIALQANAGEYPASVDPAGALTGQFTLDSLTLTRPNDATTPNFGDGPRLTLTADTPVFLDVYTSFDGSSFSGYLGSSSSSVSWTATVADQPYSFSFVGLTMQSDQKYWLVFSEDAVEGEVSNFRLKVNTSGANDAAGPGKGYLVGDTAQVLAQNNTIQDWGVNYTATFTPIPEPTALALGFLGGVLFVFRSRK